MGSAVGESFSRSHGCTSYSLHPPLQCWVPYRSLAAPMWPSVDSLPLASRSSSCNDVTPCLALSLSLVQHPPLRVGNARLKVSVSGTHVCCWSAIFEFELKLSVIPVIGVSLVRLSTMARPDIQKGLLFRDTRQRPDLLPIQHRLSLPGKYSWIPVITENTYYIFFYTFKVLYRTLNWIGEPAAP